MTDIVIASAARTPVGSFNGAFGAVSAHYLGQVAITEAIKRAKVAPGDVDEVIMGQILTAGQGQNPARQAAVNAGIPVEKTAYGINQLCGSGLRAVALGLQAIANGDSNIVVAGGQESMSQAPHAIHMRGGVKMGQAEMLDTMIKDGLWDAFHGYHMGTTAENVATKWQITREEQDKFATASQNKAEAAQKAGKFKDEIVPVTIKTRKGDVVVADDEYPKHGTTLDSLAKLRPAFSKDGTVTAGNASGVNDGSAALLIASEAAVKKFGLTPKARVIGAAAAGVPPRIMGIGPVPATQKLLARGARLTELLKQPQYSPLPVEEQVVSIFAGVNGYLDGVEVKDVGRFEAAFMSEIRAKHQDIVTAIRNDREIKPETDKKLRGVLEAFVKTFA
ncbi:MAG: acetyl-CoA C-acyltransferase [Alphaproteobacteria bacterium]|nr:acetyl-CoA C-acyltransferase [Alphaproteobacteria bacterium]